MSAIFDGILAALGAVILTAWTLVVEVILPLLAPVFLSLCNNSNVSDLSIIISPLSSKSA